MKVALVQAAPAMFDPTQTLDRFEHWLNEAQRQNAKLAVFPEAFIGGYPKGADFDVKIGFRTAAGREWFRQYHATALAIPSAELERIMRAVARSGLHVVLGIIERDGGTLYCTALMLGPSGAVLGKHRKLVPTAMERVVWGSGDGSTLPVLDTPIGRIGSVICWENYMPLLRMSMFQRGVQLYCAPTVDDRDVWIASMRHIACEGRCFVLSCCQFARRSDFPAAFPTSYADDPATVLIRGGSCIVDPLGDIVAGPEYGREGIISADIDIDQVTRGKFDLDVTGHYARPDVFRLSVDTRAKSSVSFVQQDLLGSSDESDA